MKTYFLFSFMILSTFFGFSQFKQADDLSFNQNQTCDSLESCDYQFQENCNHRHYDIPEYFTYGDQIFDFSFKGIRKMLEAIKEEDPAIYNELYPRYKKMKNNAVLAYTLGGVSVLTGAVILISAIDGGPDVGDPDFDKKMDDSKETGKVILGFGVILGGSAIAYLIAPKKQDIFTLININNKYNKKKKIEWRLGYNLQTNTPKVGLCFTF